MEMSKTQGRRWGVRLGVIAQILASPDRYSEGERLHAMKWALDLAGQVHPLPFRDLDDEPAAAEGGEAWGAEEDRRWDEWQDQVGVLRPRPVEPLKPTTRW